jgi:hypothetical protein
MSVINKNLPQIEFVNLLTTDYKHVIMLRFFNFYPTLFAKPMTIVLYSGIPVILIVMLLFYFAEKRLT